MCKNAWQLDHNCADKEGNLHPCFVHLRQSRASWQRKLALGRVSGGHRDSIGDRCLPKVGFLNYGEHPPLTYVIQHQNQGSS